MVAARTRTRRDAREAILRAAEDLFGERGWSAVSARDVARRARVTKALVFYHFESMEQLFEEVLDRYYAAQTAALEGALAREGPVEDRLLRLIDAYVDFIDEHHAIPRLVQQEVRRGGPALEKIKNNLTVLLEWTERALGDVLPPEGPLAPRHFYFTIGGMVIQYYAYAPALGPLTDDARRERRAHVRWVVGAMLERLLEERGRGSRR